MKGCVNMDSKNIKTTPNGEPPQNLYDDGNIPNVDLPQTNVTPDMVPSNDNTEECN